MRVCGRGFAARRNTGVPRWQPDTSDELTPGKESVRAKRVQGWPVTPFATPGAGCSVYAWMSRFFAPGEAAQVSRLKSVAGCARLSWSSCFLEDSRKRPFSLGRF